ncbi:nuclear transport factor 2 family protein [Microbacterium sp. LRZ72]|uniref:nuclear transport factor 2 family protein n=1 Tax=Microbacterium sp. LRZ72 TaxID=2942481 RepID=UPI0029B2FA9A|nr:nuclear transport factor 2 family protein [Microbacterium sp. LRZ72]MDX2376358.1 nuclear transport factor 2 family protein [Microbacterium sp. LRZ72]
MNAPDLETRAAIADLNARFAWALDLHDYDALRDILTEDVHYVSVGRELHGVDEVVASFHARTGVRTTRHGLGNLLLAAESAGVVHGRSSWHTFASNADPPVGVDLYMVADFDDVYRRIDGRGWRISARRIRPVFRVSGLAPDAAPTPQ